MLLGDRENAVLEMCAKRVISHFQFRCPALFTFRLEQSVHNLVSCTLSVIAGIRRIGALVLGIVDGPNMMIRETEQLQEQLRRECRSFQIDRIVTIVEQNAEQFDSLTMRSRLDRSDTILKRGYTEVGIDPHERRQPNKISSSGRLFWRR